MALNPLLLGGLFVTNTQNTDPVGAALMVLLGAPFVAWTLANVVVNPLAGTPLVALGPVVTGTGGLVVGPPQPLGLLLAAAVGSVDPASLAKWQVVAAHYAEKLTSGGGIFNTSTLVAWVGPLPPVGPVTGVGVGIALAAPFDFATALEITDAVAGAKWTAMGAALETQLKLALITPTMTNAINAPLLGTGAVT